MRDGPTQLEIDLFRLKFGSILVMSAGDSLRTGRLEAGFGGKLSFDPMAVDPGPNLDESGLWAKLCRIRPDVGQFWANAGRIRAKFGRVAGKPVTTPLPITSDNPAARGRVGDGAARRRSFMSRRSMRPMISLSNFDAKLCGLDPRPAWGRKAAHLTKPSCATRSNSLRSISLCVARSHGG